MLSLRGFFLLSVPLRVGLSACIPDCLMGSHYVSSGFLRSPLSPCSCYPFVSHSYRFYPSRVREFLASSYKLLVRCILYTHEVSIRLIPAVLINDRLSPPFAVDAASTTCSPLLRLEDHRRLSSINGNALHLLRFQAATIPIIQDSHIHSKDADIIPYLILGNLNSNYVLDHRNEGSTGDKKEQ